MKMLSKLAGEYKYFQGMPHNMRVLLITNMLYSMVLPVVEVFLAAYIMRYLMKQFTCNIPAGHVFRMS
jgi:YQGE family putative transporter